MFFRVEKCEEEVPVEVAAGPLRDSRIEVAGGRELVAKSRSTRRRRTYRLED
jgi:hypothetical protein